MGGPGDVIFLVFLGLFTVAAVVTLIGIAVWDIGGGE